MKSSEEYPLRSNRWALKKDIDARSLKGSKEILTVIDARGFYCSFEAATVYSVDVVKGLVETVSADPFGGNLIVSEYRTVRLDVYRFYAPLLGVFTQSLETIRAKAACNEGLRPWVEPPPYWMYKLKVDPAEPEVESTVEPSSQGKETAGAVEPGEGKAEAANVVDNPPEIARSGTGPDREGIRSSPTWIDLERVFSLGAWPCTVWDANGKILENIRGFDPRTGYVEELDRKTGETYLYRVPAPIGFMKMKSEGRTGG